MFDFLSKLLNKNMPAPKMELTKDEIAAYLKVTPKALAEFESAYSKAAINEDSGLFDTSVQSVKSETERFAGNVHADLENLITRIVDELVADTFRMTIKDNKVAIEHLAVKSNAPDVTLEELLTIPKEFRPQCTANYMMKDIKDDSSKTLLFQYQSYQNAKDSKKKQTFYHLFRQGLDILDLDPILYEMLGQNQNNMGNWLPELADAASKQNFFKIPDTTIIKVPMPLLQLSRKDYESINATTKQILNRYCMSVFCLDDTKDYFVKTGTYSSKFDFRNAHVTAGKEVHELGEYLLFIQNQACIAAGPLVSPSTYGMSTTNEWCVREYIHDTEQNPRIYHGMPLHTEYRAFIDLDTKEVLMVVPYWDAKTMKRRLGEESDAEQPTKKHDYIIYTMHEQTLMDRFNANADTVIANLQTLIRNMNGTGQWSLDIMQNGNDFWLIDMATASTSALKEYLPKEYLKTAAENWLPDLTQAH